MVSITEGREDFRQKKKIKTAISFVFSSLIRTFAPRKGTNRLNKAAVDNLSGGARSIFLVNNNSTMHLFYAPEM